MYRRLPTALLLLLVLACCPQAISAISEHTLEFSHGVPFLIEKTPPRCAAGMSFGARDQRPLASVLEKKGKTLTIYGGKKNFSAGYSITLPAPATFLPPAQVDWGSSQSITLLQPVGSCLYQVRFHPNWPNSGPYIHSVDLSQIHGSGELLLTNPSPWKIYPEAGVYVAFNPKRKEVNPSLFLLTATDSKRLENLFAVRELDWKPPPGSKLTAPIWRYGNSTALTVAVSTPNGFPEILGFDRFEKVSWIIRLGKDSDETSLRGKHVVAIKWVGINQSEIVAIVEMEARKRYHIFSMSGSGVPLFFGPPLSVEETLAIYEALPRYETEFP